MEKKVAAAVASLTLAALLAGVLLGGTVARPPPITVTSYMTVKETVTVAETTVEVPVKHQPAPYSARAFTSCIYTETMPEEDPECSRNTKVVRITILFRELGVERSYLRLDGPAVIVPGLGRIVEAQGSPLDAKGRVVVMPGSSASVSLVAPVSDLFSFGNWIADIGKIAVAMPYEDYEGRELGTLTIEGIPLDREIWWFKANSTEVGG